MKKIVISSGDTASLGGFRLSLIRHLISRGYSVETISPSPDATASVKLEALGVRMHFVALNRNGISPLADIFYLWRVWRKLVAIHPEAILSYTHKPCVYSMISAAIAGVPSRCALITGLGYPFMVQRGIKHAVIRWTIRILYRISSRATTTYIFQNSDDRSYFAEIGILRHEHRTVLVGGSGVPLDEFTPSPMPTGHRFLMLSRLLVSKGVPLYIKAAKQIVAADDTAKFVLAGATDSSPDALSSPDMEVLESGEPVDYLGKIQDVRAEIALSAVVVLPSFYREGIPRALLEALSCGRPIISTDMPGCRETLAPGALDNGPGWERRPNGYLITPCSSEALVGAIRDFLKLDYAEKAEMGLASRKLAVRKFDAAVVNKLIETTMA